MEQNLQLFILKIYAVVYHQFCAIRRSKSSLPGISLYSNGKAAALQQLAESHVRYLLPVVTISILPTLEVPTKICVSQEMVYTEVLGEE